MDPLKIGDIWTLMSKYTFKHDSELNSEDMHCIICNKLMIDACHSVCGCQYCFKCISEHLSTGNGYCPGVKSLCKEEQLSMDRDIIRSSRTNNRIFKLTVECPNGSCQSKIEMAHMSEHLRVCNKPSVICPYTNIGCDNGGMSKDALLAHLSDETLSHTQLLMRYVQNLENEVNVLKDNFEKSKLEIISLKDESFKKEIEIGNIIKQMKEEKKEIIEQLTNQNGEISQQLKELNWQIECAREESVTKEEKISFLEEKLKKVNYEIKRELSTMIHETKERQIDSTSQNERRIEKWGQQIDQTRKQLHNIKTEMQLLTHNLNDRNDRMQKNWKSLCPLSCVDFVWRIEKWTLTLETKKYTRIFSPPFYSNNYKLCLYLYILSDDEIGLCCMVLNGENDDVLEWPIRLTVTLSIIDQDTFRAYKSDRLQYDTYNGEKIAFNRPSNNCGIGSFELIKYSRIKDCPSVIVNDSIVVSCNLSDP